MQHSNKSCPGVIQKYIQDFQILLECIFYILLYFATNSMKLSMLVPAAPINFPNSKVCLNIIFGNAMQTYFRLYSH